MKSNFKRLGDCIQVIDERNSDLSVKRFLGININKNFIRSVANTSGIDFSKYKIVSRNRFACNIMHVGRDERLPIALYRDDKNAIVSPAYVVFEVINPNELLPEYLMMIFQRSEFDRFTWFVSDSSVRGGLEWERFCDIEIPVPLIDEQRKFVALYNGLLNNQSAYERSLNDLQLICDTFMDSLTKTVQSQPIGDYIRQVDERNYNLQISLLRGVTTGKKLIKSVTNTSNLEFSGYKIVRNRQFVYVPDTGRRSEKIGIALNDAEPCIVSNIYIIFEPKDNNVLMPEFLLLWFKRAEFDRYARFHSWGSVREIFSWEEMCEVKVPIPDIEVQKSIVAIHHTLETRKRINEKLKSMIAPLCPILMRGVIDNLPKLASVEN